MLVLTSTALAVSSGKLYLGVEDILWRLLCAMVVGMVIGIEREYTHRPAGMRTHILVSLGSCAVMITGQLIYAEYSAYGATPDPARLAAQVIAGVGFLGAGTIMREGANVKGLTTAASLWCVACLGIAAGGGYYAVALVGMVFIFITLTLFEFFQNKLIKPKVTKDYTLQVADIAVALDTVHTLADQCKGQISNLRAEAIAEGHILSFRVQFASGKKWPLQFFKGLSEAGTIRDATIADDTVAV